MTSTNFIEFSRPFVNAAKNVFETMVFTKLDPQKPVLKKDGFSRGDISAILGITGKITLQEAPDPMDFRAMLVISWPFQTYLNVASAMLMETYKEYCDDIADVGGEICNMVMGNAKRELAGLGYSLNMAIPSMIKGEGHIIKYPPKTTVIMIPLNSAHGQMFLELCYRED